MSDCGVKNNRIDLLKPVHPNPLPHRHPITYDDLMQYMAFEVVIHLSNSNMKQKNWTDIIDSFKVGIQSLSSFWNLPSEKFVQSRHHNAKKLQNDFSAYQRGSDKSDKYSTIAEIIYQCHCYQKSSSCYCYIIYG